MIESEIQQEKLREKNEEKKLKNKQR